MLYKVFTVSHRSQQCVLAPLNHVLSGQQHTGEQGGGAGTWAQKTSRVRTASTL